MFSYVLRYTVGTFISDGLISENRRLLHKSF